MLESVVVWARMVVVVRKCEEWSDSKYILKKTINLLMDYIWEYEKKKI